MSHHDILLEPQGLRVLVMGLGLNGGGLAVTRYFAERGARVTVTDLNNEEKLKPSLEKLKDFDIHYVLGTHRETDFEQADLVVKNPGVRRDSPFLKRARRIATDIEIFLAQCPNPIYAVTGSKGKSSTVSALHQMLLRRFPRALLGGNITRSPLEFLGQLDGESPVVLELSSWQLGDLDPPSLLEARGAVLTNLYHDHMNYYASMEAYAQDKERIFSGQRQEDWGFVNLDNPWGAFFAQKVRAQLGVLSLKGRLSHPRASLYGYYQKDTGYVEWKGKRLALVPADRRSSGLASDWALLFASSLALVAEVPPDLIRQAASEYEGIPHRMELCHNWKGVRFINDTAATIPEASSVSYASIEGRVHWITGGTDKNLNLEPLEKLNRAPATLSLLEGSASTRMFEVFQKKGWVVRGWYRDFDSLLESLRDELKTGDTVLLSPGAASFELFKNEFDRGEQFIQACRRIYEE